MNISQDFTYEKYWSLNKKPFENTPDPTFMYESEQHFEGLMLMLYAITQQRGAAMLTGEVGCGKTLLSRAIVQNLDLNKYEVSIIINPALTAIELLQTIVSEFGIELPAPKEGQPSRRELLNILNEFLLKNLNQGKETLIIIDEAQMIKEEETLDEIRALLNFQLNERFLLTLMLIGQPELLDMINKLPQLEQRLSVRWHLGPLKESEISEYISHRLWVAGNDPNREIFTDDAVKLIYQESKGIPRVINTICDMCLFIGYMRKVRKIEANIVKMCIKTRHRDIVR